MATTVWALRWLDRLEQEFDKAFTDLDLQIGQLDEEEDFVELARERLGTLSSAFAQLCHKAQTIFHNNAKLEAQLVDMRTDLCQAKAELLGHVSEKAANSPPAGSAENTVSNAAHPAPSGQPAAAAAADEAGTSPTRPTDDGSRNSSQSPASVDAPAAAAADPSSEAVDVVTAAATASGSQPTSAVTDPQQQQQSLLYNRTLVGQLEQENKELRQYILALQGEVYGARLAAKYLDKELAGRIQQIQLLGRSMNNSDKEKLWSQLEAEIQLHRHKTVIRACQGRKVETPHGAPEALPRKRRNAEQPRTVILNRDTGSVLGLSVTGGSEHGVPVLISDVKPGSLAAACGQLRVGDAILSVNGISLGEARHAQAVELLSKQRGELKLEVLYVEPDPDSSDEHETVEDESGFRYKIYDRSLSQGHTSIAAGTSQAAATCSPTANSGVSSSSSEPVPLPSQTAAAAADGHNVRRSEVELPAQETGLGGASSASSVLAPGVKLTDRAEAPGLRA